MGICGLLWATTAALRCEGFFSDLSSVVGNSTKHLWGHCRNLPAHSRSPTGLGVVSSLFCLVATLWRKLGWGWSSGKRREIQTLKGTISYNREKFNLAVWMRVHIWFILLLWAVLFNGGFSRQTVIGFNLNLDVLQVDFFMFIVVLIFSLWLCWTIVWAIRNLQQPQEETLKERQNLTRLQFVESGTFLRVLLKCRSQWRQCLFRSRVRRRVLTPDTTSASDAEWEAPLAPRKSRVVASTRPCSWRVPSWKTTSGETRQEAGPRGTPGNCNILFHASLQGKKNRSDLIGLACQELR